MLIIKKTLLILCIILTSAGSFAQNNDSIVSSRQDSISRSAISYITRQFAITRPLNIEFSTVSPYNYTAKSDKGILAGGKMNGYSQIKANATFNFIKKRNWLLGTTLGYRYTNVDAHINEEPTANSNSIHDNFHYQYSSLNFTYFSKFLDRTTIYTTNLIVDGSEKHFERVKGLISGTMVLKANERTKIMAGLALYIDPSLQVPLIPTFTLEHRFNNGLMADIMFPSRVMLRKHFFNKARLSLGTELDRTAFYLYNINPNNNSQKYEYRQIVLNNGLVYEHLLGENFVLTARTGLKSIVIGRLFEKEESFGSPLIKVSQDPSFYFNIGISFNPFSKVNK